MVAEAQAVVEIVKDGLEAGDKALDLYNKILDQLIPWKTFEETIDNLTKYEKDYSNAAGEIVAQVKTLLLNSRDEYFKATQSVFEWSSVASQLLTAYVQLFENYNQEKAKAQKSILLKVLTDGIDKMTVAQASLHASSKSFNDASGHISSLRTQLNNDFVEGSNYYDMQVDKLRKEAYGGAAVGLVLGPFGLLISYSIAAGVLEGKLIPALKEKLEEMKEHFEALEGIISKASDDIDGAKTKLQEEIVVIGNMKSQTETTSLYVEYDDLMLNLLKDSARKLIDQCSMYIERHGARGFALKHVA